MDANVDLKTDGAGERLEYLSILRKQNNDQKREKHKKKSVWH